MAQKNLISITFTAEETAAINTAITSLQEKLLPKLRSIKDEEKKEITKMGDKSVTFVRKALEYCKATPDITPAYFDITEFENDLKAYDELRTYLTSLQQITDGIISTMTLAGSDAYKAALSYYGSVKGAMENNIVKSNVIYDDLSTRFKEIGKKKNGEDEK